MNSLNVESLDYDHAKVLVAQSEDVVKAYHWAMYLTAIDKNYVDSYYYLHSKQESDGTFTDKFKHKYKPYIYKTVKGRPNVLPNYVKVSIGE